MYNLAYSCIFLYTLVYSCILLYILVYSCLFWILCEPPCVPAQDDDEEDEPEELLLKPKEYKVKFSFPNPPPLKPPILGLYGMRMGMEVHEGGVELGIGHHNDPGAWCNIACVPYSLCRC